MLCLKLIEAAALCLLAWSAGRIAEHWQPARGRLAAGLVGLCPLSLLEGVGSGHNDLRMTACLFTAIALLLERRHARAGLWLGLAVGIKMLPLALLPWLILNLARTLPDICAHRKAIFQLVGEMLLPLVLGYACFWHGGAVWDALHRRTQIGHGTLLWAGLAYVALSIWLWTQKGASSPWYLSWFWPALALRGGRVYRGLFEVVFMFALVWENLHAA